MGDICVPFIVRTMFKFLKKLKRKSIYGEFLDAKKEGKLNEFLDIQNPGEYELNYMRNPGAKVSTFDLNKALMDFYNRERESIAEAEEFFKTNRAIESIDNFAAFLYGQDNFQEDRLPGLSILLMRDSKEIEAVKFGILLAEYYNLENYYRALEIIRNLGEHPEFTYYSVRVLKNINDGDRYVEEIYENTFGMGKKIIEVANEIR